MKRSRKSFLSRLAVAAVVAAGCAVVVLAAERAEADIINPSFETVDLTGWTGLASWTILADGGSDGLYYASVLSPEPEPPGGPTIPPDENQGWATAIEQVFTMPGWAETLSIDIRNEGLTVTVHLSQDGAVPFIPINILDGAASQAPNGFTRYTAAVSQYAGLDVRLTVNVSADDVPPARLRTSVDNVLVVPEPATLMLLMVWVPFALGGLGLLCRRCTARRHYSRAREMIRRPSCEALTSERLYLTPWDSVV